jgi:hypothetical protein
MNRLTETMASPRTTHALVVAFVLLTVFSMWQFAEQQQTKADTETVKEQLAELCESGAVDCRGVGGLPGHQGPAGTGITSMRCNTTTGQWRVVLGGGATYETGDCIAEAGPRGLRGFTGADSTVPGPRGPIGRTGATGPRGRTCVEELGVTACQGPRGNPGERGLRGPAGPRGQAGPQGPKGPQGPQGPQGPTGNPGGNCPPKNPNC